MTNVYIVAIIAAAVVVLLVALLYRGLLTSGIFRLRGDELSAELRAKDRRPERPMPRTPGKTEIDDNLLAKAQVDLPAEVDVKIRKNRAFGSKITVRDAPAEKDSPP